MHIKKGIFTITIIMFTGSMILNGWFFYKTSVENRTEKITTGFVIRDTADRSIRLFLEYVMNDERDWKSQEFRNELFNLSNNIRDGLWLVTDMLSLQGGNGIPVEERSRIWGIHPDTPNLLPAVAQMQKVFNEKYYNTFSEFKENYNQEDEKIIKELIQHFSEAGWTNEGGGEYEEVYQTFSESVENFLKYEN